MLRSGPLQELPLAQFLPLNPNIDFTPSKPTHLSSKRPLSPGTASFYSPVKRRILTEDGIFTSESKPNEPIVSSARGRTATSYFHELLQGPDSPVKKLDFGSTKAGSAQDAPAESDAASPSETIASKGRSQGASLQPKLSNSLSLNSSKPSLPTSSTSSRQLEVVKDDCFSPRSNPINHSTPSTPIPAVTPRNPCDPQSIHFPGFAVFIDTRDHTPTADLLVSDCGTDELSNLRDNEKENVAPGSRAPRAKTGAGSYGSPQYLRPNGGSAISSAQRKQRERSISPSPLTGTNSLEGKDHRSGRSSLSKLSRHLCNTGTARDGCPSLTSSPSPAPFSRLKGKGRRALFEDQVDDD